MSQFEALLDRQFEQHRRDRICAGIVAASATNLFADPPVSPLIFVPESRHFEQAKPATKAETDDMIATMAAFLGAGPGQPSNTSKVH